jgi:hypothetical protein
MSFVPNPGPADEIQRAMNEIEKKVHPVRYWTYVIIMLALLVIIGIGYAAGHTGNPVPGPNPTIGGTPVLP